MAGKTCASLWLCQAQLEVGELCSCKAGVRGTEVVLSIQTECVISRDLLDELPYARVSLPASRDVRPTEGAPGEAQALETPGGWAQRRILLVRGHARKGTRQPVLGDPHTARAVAQVGELGATLVSICG